MTDTIILEGELVEITICETARVVLRPFTIYRVVVSPDCPACLALASAYDFNPATWPNMLPEERLALVPVEGNA